MFQIRSATPITVQIDDDVVSFSGDPTEEALLGLLSAQDQFVGKSVAEQIAGIGALRSALGMLVLPGSAEAFAALEARGLLTIGVVMQLFEHLVDRYGAALGFRGGSPSTSGDGRPVNAPTSEA
jgi:hypothetical protein